MSANHLIIEVDDVHKLIVDATQGELLGPRIEDNGGGKRRVIFRLPLSVDSESPCFSRLVPPQRLEEWTRWLTDDTDVYERRYESILREQLGDHRRGAMKELPEFTQPFLEHLEDWIVHRLVPSSVGLGDFDDRWLSRIQLTAIASAIWGPIWITNKLSLGDIAESELQLTASCTVTGKRIEGALVDDDGVALDHRIDDFANECSSQLTKHLEKEMKRHEVGVLLELARHPERSLMRSSVKQVGRSFSAILGESLIGEDHESKPLRLRGILTPGLDSLKMTAPTRIKILYEIDGSQFRLSENSNDYWGVWKSLFKSNDLLLSKEGVALHFELELSPDRSTVLPAPRHVIQLIRPLDAFLKGIGDPPPGLLQQGFEASERMATHFRKVSNKSGVFIVEQRVQRKGQPFPWGGDSQGDAKEIDWTVISKGLHEALVFIEGLEADPFFKDAALTLSSLSAGQITQMADGIAEVCRQEYGCLIFIGRVCRKRKDNSYWFDGDPNLPSMSRFIEITRLGLSLPTVSQVPEAPSLEFRQHFGDMAGMDGETIISAWPTEAWEETKGYEAYLPSGSLLGGRFVQLPKGTPALLDPIQPRLSDKYGQSWEIIRGSITTGYLHSIERVGLSCRFLASRESDTAEGVLLNRSDLLSLGTRHRKAAMTTMRIPSVVAITCSSSSNIKVWLRGVPIVDIKPNKDILLPHLPPQI